MNVTALNNYLKCPLEFYFRNLIRIPSPKNESTEFGSAVHKALEQLFRYMQDHDNHFPDIAFFLASFDTYMKRHRESFTREQFARRMEYGHIILPAYYEKYIRSWNKIVSIERPLGKITVGGVPAKGFLDKLEFDGKQVNVVDYKTGNPDNAIPKVKGPSEKSPLGGDYWRQAVFYKLLVDNSQLGWQVISTEFDFVEPDKKKEYRKMKVYVNPADEAIVTKQITDTWTKIQNHDFYTGCGKEDCHWCNFVKTNKLEVLATVAEEEDQASL
jgi:DNA helicase-2/ATP-dependent DNA helicase PcrA